MLRKNFPSRKNRRRARALVQVMHRIRVANHMLQSERPDMDPEQIAFWKSKKKCAENECATLTDRLGM